MTKNTHMTHLEDKVLYGGVDGTRQAIVAVRELKNLLRSDQSGSVSVKWDGAPSIFAGIDPSDGDFLHDDDEVIMLVARAFLTSVNR